MICATALSPNESLIWRVANLLSAQKLLQKDLLNLLEYLFILRIIILGELKIIWVHGMYKIPKY